MRRICIVVADASRAHLYTFEELAAPAGEPTQELRKHADLVQPARRRRPSELFCESRPGLDRAPNGRGFAYDDRRTSAIRSMDRAFAARIAAQLEALIRTEGCREVILAASPRMLGFLREATGARVGAGVVIHEMDRDLVRLSRSELHELLAARHLLPARERVGADSNSRAAHR